MLGFGVWASCAHVELDLRTCLESGLVVSGLRVWTMFFDHPIAYPIPLAPLCVGSWRHFPFFCNDLTGRFTF